MSFIVIRAKDLDKVKIALSDIKQYGQLEFSSCPKRIDSEYADEILINVMNTPLKCRCNSAALVEMDCDGCELINILRRIHPPAHLVVVTPKHQEVYEELLDSVEIYPEIN
ncbi:MAG: DUF356 domain-containing protein [Methanosarcinaceae archaeon]|jgi:hypothetical protein|nr:DUF356 domain-containing protein [Methanosarcinaceae archaeon]NKQ38943.1 DUF356 domain-containing protein [Methanosarcinales archaeon]